MTDGYLFDLLVAPARKSFDFFVLRFQARFHVGALPLLSLSLSSVFNRFILSHVCFRYGVPSRPV